jgi:tRNA/rRNA methyltransferase
MNLGQAVAVCLYEIVRSEHAKLSTGPAEHASAEKLERITAVLLNALRDSGYLNPKASQTSEAKVRRLIRRLHLDAGDAELLLGMLRQILWKLRSPK